MTLQQLRCTHCNAPIELTEGATTVRCAYCQQSFVVPKAAAPEIQVHVVRVEAPAEQAPAASVGGGAAAAVGKLAGILAPLLVFAVIWATSTGKNPLHWLGVGLWDGKTPLVCSGNDRVEVHDVTATFPSGVAVSASGNCQVRLTNCTLRADTAVEATGNAHVVLVGGTAQGSKASADASGNARIESQGAKLVGKTKQSGNGRVQN